MPSSQNARPTEPITGGCLCGAVRYEIDFPEGSSWPPRRSTCQCTMCRKWTGTLIPQGIEIPRKDIRLPSSETSMFKAYESSENCSRTFCDRCGSSITFQEDGVPSVQVWVGTVDEKWLIGEKVEGSEREMEGRTVFNRKGGYPNDLCTSDDNIYLENAIAGITDGMVGARYSGDKI